LTTYGLFLKALKRQRNADEMQEPAKELMRFRDTATTRRITANIAKLPELLRQRSRPTRAERAERKPRRWRAAGEFGAIDEAYTSYRQWRLILKPIL